MRVGEIPVAMIHSSLVGSRNFERGEAAAREVGPDAHALPLDVTDQASITAAAKRVRNEFGRLDVLIQNAATSNTSKLPGQTVAEICGHHPPQQGVPR
jgi:NAD(P)-dependent dehydrogenase (short-subunit alcohol dehydrogenase family)